jgi:glutathione S-transferase
MESNFSQEHESAFPGQTVPRSGYPDMGNGRFSQKLTYEQWFSFNNAQRSHYNYMESVTCVLCWLLIGGIGYNWYAVGAGSVYLVGRLLYTIGYISKGPAGRVGGFVISMLASTMLFVLSIISPLRMAGVIAN